MQQDLFSWPGRVSCCSCVSFVKSKIYIVFIFQGCEHGFTHITDNPFTNTRELSPFGGGIRIDYILFKVNVLDFTVGQITSKWHLHSIPLFFRDTHYTHFFLHMMPTHRTDSSTLWMSESCAGVIVLKSAAQIEACTMNWQLAVLLYERKMNLCNSIRNTPHVLYFSIKWFILAHITYKT